MGVNCAEAIDLVSPILTFPRIRGKGLGIVRMLANERKEPIDN
jgi:hypothetical protein